MNTSDQLLHKQLKPLALFFGLTVIVLTATITLAAHGLMNSFGKVEHDSVHQMAKQTYRAFETDLNQLAISNRDYAEWDDAEEYVRSHDTSFLKANFSADTNIAMHVDLVWIVDGSGHDMFSTLIDRDHNTATSPAPADLLEQLRVFQTTDRSFRNKSPADRLIRTSQGLAAVSAIEITRSDRSMATGNTMLFARFIRGAEVRRVSETSHLPVELLFLDSSDRTQPVVPTEVSRWIQTNSLSSGDTFVKEVDEDRIDGYALVRDVNDQPVALLHTNSPRDIRALGINTSWYLLSSIVLLFLAFGITVFLLVLRMLRLIKRDAEHRQHAEAQTRENRRNLVKQAQRDALTGLPNRLYLHSRLPKLLGRVARSSQLLAVIHIDIDHFKNINESLGHSAGDQLLQSIATRIRSALAPHDFVVRTSADEFVVVAPLVPDAQYVERLVAGLQSAISTDVSVGNSTLSVLSSAGIALYPDNALDTESLLRCADIALHQAKEAGRNCRRLFTPDMDTAVCEHALLEQALRRSLGTAQFYMDFQPIVDLRDRRVVSLEALIRWKHPDMGLISPGRFISVAERSGLISDLGEFALRMVMAQQRTWLDNGVPIVPIAVNISPAQMERTDFVALVQKLAAEFQIELRWIRFEVTESIMVKQPEHLIKTLRHLRILGCKVLIDDFGTGYSSLSYLDRLPVDILKIDQSFVRNLTKDGVRAPIIDAVIGIAKRLHLKTVAEGIETPEQAQLLAELGCTYGQGYLYSKPVAASHCRRLLELLNRERSLTETTIFKAFQKSPS